jgi:hypothetical protein
MLVVETIAKIGRAFFLQGKAIKAICRRGEAPGRFWPRGWGLSP